MEEGRMGGGEVMANTAEGRMKIQGEWKEYKAAWLICTDERRMEGQGGKKEHRKGRRQRKK